MRRIKAWRYRLYPSKMQEKELNRYLNECKTLWNSLLGHARAYHKQTGKFPTRDQLYLHAKEVPVFSQVAQNVADRLSKALCGMITKKRFGANAGFPRFKPIERMKSFTYPQFGFKLGNKLELAKIGKMRIIKHREVKGTIKTLTIKRMPSGKWFAIFNSELEVGITQKRDVPSVGLDLGVEYFAYLSDGTIIENPRCLMHSEEKLNDAYRNLSKKKKGSNNRIKAKVTVAIAHEKLSNRRMDFLHKTSRKLVEKYSFIAMENLNVAGMAKGFLAKSVLDCSWAEFSGMLAYKAADAGCEVVLVNPANTTSECSNCGSVQKKSLAERWHKCACGASMHRDLNAAINILKKAASGTGVDACGKETHTHYKDNGQVSSMKQEAYAFGHG